MAVWRQMLPSALLVVPAAKSKPGEGGGWLVLHARTPPPKSRAVATATHWAQSERLPACLCCGFYNPRCVSDTDMLLTLSASVLLSHGFLQSVDLKLVDCEISQPDTLQ